MIVFNFVLIRSFSMSLKGLIVAAGYGSRFLPITKTIPKEMLPIINIPALQFIVQEMVEAGIEDIVIITHRKKKALEDYFDKDPELFSFFTKQKKEEALKLIKPCKANISFIRQQEMKGTGDAVLLAKPWIGDNPFVVAFPDDLVFGKKGLTLQMVEAYQKHQKSILSALKIEGDVSPYGVFDLGQKIEEKTYWLKGIVEKPNLGLQPSQFISVGRYLFTPQIFDKLVEQKKHHQTGEFFLTQGILELAQENQALAYQFEGKRLDTGTPEGYLEAILEYAFSKPSYKQIILDFIKKQER